jgi:hypothetical protein
MTVTRSVHTNTLRRASALALFAALALSGCPRTQEVLAISALAHDEGAAGATPDAAGAGGSETEGCGGTGSDVTEYWSGSGASCRLARLHRPDGTAGNGGRGAQEPCLVTGEMAEDGVCSLLGQWRTTSREWNDLPTDALIDFHEDGTFTGSPEFTGEYCLDGTDLAVAHTFGPDMTCDGETRWSIVFTADCRSAVLCLHWDGCTGARRYLDWPITLSRP